MFFSSQHRRLALAFGLLMATLTRIALAELTVYPAPNGAPANTDWTVEAREADGQWTPLFVYDAAVGPEREGHMGFVMFDSDFTRPIELRLRARHLHADGTMSVRPASANVTPQRKGDDHVLEVTRPMKVSVEIDGDIWSNLLVIANPLDVPPPQDLPGLVYFGPGVHLLGGDGTGTVPIEAGSTVYLAGGAIVYGRVDFGGKDNVTLRGRGILCGSRFSHDLARPRAQLLYAGKANHLRVEGLTLLDSPSWNMHLHQVNDAVVANVNILSWIVNTDGIDPRGCQNLLIEDCFIRTADDCVSIKLANSTDPKSVTQRNKQIIVRNSTMWPDKAHALLIGPEGDCAHEQERITEDVTFSNIDVLRVNEMNPDFYGALSIMAADRQVIRNVLFEDIRVAPIESGNLIDIRFVNNEYTADFGKRIEKIHFRNIQLSGPNASPNRILGHDAKRTVSDVLIERLRINDKIVETREAADIEINAFVENPPLK